MRVLPLILLTACLAACGTNFGFPGVYRINVEQGNIVTNDMVAELKEGMSRRQVRFIMGTPLIEDTFNGDRWDYRYTLRNGNLTLRTLKVSVIFEGDELVGVEGDIAPVWAGGTAGAEPEEPTSDETPADDSDNAASAEPEAADSSKPL